MSALTSVQAEAEAGARGPVSYPAPYGNDPTCLVAHSKSKLVDDSRTRGSCGMATMVTLFATATVGNDLDRALDSASDC
jgi:hypothetical protein